MSQRKIDGTGPGAFEELAVEGSRGKRAHRGRLWRMLGKDQYRQGMWEYFSLERLRAKKLMKDAEKEKQEGIQGQWQQESPAKEFLDRVKSSVDTDCTPRMMRFGYYALKDGDWEE